MKERWVIGEDDDVVVIEDIIEDTLDGKDEETLQ
jgi:hypothetical protein